jgi:four helix bundle protein
MGKYNELLAYKLSYALAKEVFLITKGFPKEELFGLSDQIRRSSRSVCVNIVEAYRKRIYPKHFVMKLSDADGECSETIVWIDMAFDFGYIHAEIHDHLLEEYERVGRIIGTMMKSPAKFR